MNSNWTSWRNIKKIPNKDQPGIYFLAVSKSSLEGKKFKMISNIIYIGMNISKKGVYGRLYQFEKAMEGKNGVHGGAERVRFDFSKEELFDKLYVSVKSFPLSSERNSADDWRVKGDCVRHEYHSFGDYMEQFGKLPKYNDPKSPKKF